VQNSAADTAEIRRCTDQLISLDLAFARGGGAVPPLSPRRRRLPGRSRASRTSARFLPAGCRKERPPRGADVRKSEPETEPRDAARVGGKGEGQGRRRGGGDRDKITRGGFDVSG